MLDISALFTHRTTYILPDGTPVMALWIEFVEQPRWWFAEQLPDGQMGHLLVTVMPNGSVWNYSLEPDASCPEVCVPYPSDLTIEDLRPADAPFPTHFRGITAVWFALAIVDIWPSLVDTATAWQMLG